MAIFPWSPIILAKFWVNFGPILAPKGSKFVESSSSFIYRWNTSIKASIQNLKQIGPKINMLGPKKVDNFALSQVT